MATVHHLLPTSQDFYAELQERTNVAEGRRHQRFLAVLLLQKLARGYLIRKHVAWLSKNAVVIQCAFRMYRARKAYRAALRRAVQYKHDRHYDRAARRIQMVDMAKGDNNSRSCSYSSSTHLLFQVASNCRDDHSSRGRDDRSCQGSDSVGMHLTVVGRCRPALVSISTQTNALWRGYYSRRTKFCYRSYRRWLATVTERGERRAAEAVEFGLRSRADDLRILEEEARQWLAFVVFKLHHLLRTYVCAGVYSEPGSSEFSEFEKLLKSIHYTEYMKRLKRKYDEFVRKHRPRFSNKRLFPIIGDGADYWYLSLPEMYELTAAPPKKEKNTRHLATHHGPQHKQPFLWKRVRPPCPEQGRGPFTPQKSPSRILCAPSSTPVGGRDTVIYRDPRFQLYVKHYVPLPALFDYVDFHINVLLTRKYSVENVNVVQ